MSVQNLQRHVEASGVLDSPVVAKTAAGFSAASGLAGFFQLIQPALSVVSMVLGVALTVLIIRKHLRQGRQESEMHLQSMQNMRLESLKYRLEIEAMEAAAERDEAKKKVD